MTARMTAGIAPAHDDAFPTTWLIEQEPDTVGDEDTQQFSDARDFADWCADFGPLLVAIVVAALIFADAI